MDLTKQAISGITTQTYSGVYGGNQPDDNPWKMRVGDGYEDLSSWL